MSKKRLSLLSQNPHLRAEDDIEEIQVEPTQPTEAPSRLSLGVQSAGNFMAQPGMAQGVAGAASTVGGVVDPKGVGAGPALSYAAQGAATGTMVFPGIGTAVGAAIGLGLGLIKGKQNREENKRQVANQVAQINAQGQQNAAKAVRQGMVSESFAGKRRLKL